MEAIRTSMRLAREERLDEFCNWPSVALQSLVAGRLLTMAKDRPKNNFRNSCELLG